MRVVWYRSGLSVVEGAGEALMTDSTQSTSSVFSGRPAHPPVAPLTSETARTVTRPQLHTSLFTSVFSGSDVDGPEDNGAYNDDGTLIDPERAEVVMARRHIATAGTHRRYRATFMSTATIRGNRDSFARHIKYEVGARDVHRNFALNRAPAFIPAVDCSYTTAQFLADDFSSYARKYTNFSGVWDRMDLCAIVERLTFAVAYISIHGSMTWAQFCRGLVPVITVLGTTHSPVAANLTSVFIPRLVDRTLAPYVFSALVGAATAVGSSIVTDLVELDVEAGTPRFATVSDLDLAAAAVDALRVLAANFEANSAGACFAYAATRGVHSVLSVVSHTDEGGYLRTVLRATRFRPSFGAVHSGYADYVGIPALRTGELAHVTTWADSLALVTAAVVASSDPCIHTEAGVLPTFFASTLGPLAAGGIDVAGTDDDALSIARQIAARSSDFSESYTRNLRLAFGFSDGQNPAALHLNSAFLQASQRVDRHLRHKVVAPFFWIEPTSLIPAGYFSTTAEVHSFGPLVSPNHVSDGPCFEGAYFTANSAGTRQGLAVTWRTARTSRLVIHLNSHPLNGLGSATIRQADPESFLLPGARGVQNARIETRMRRSDSLDSYLWVRGQSCLAAPAECANIIGSLGMLVEFYGVDETGEVCIPTHFPARHELLESRVEYTVTKPAAIPAGDSNREDRRAMRARSLAAAAATRAANRFRGRQPEDLTMDFAYAAPARTPTANPAAAQAATGATDISDAYPPATDTVTRAHAVPAVTTLGANTGPQAIRPTAGGAHGGARPRHALAAQQPAPDNVPPDGPDIPDDGVPNVAPGADTGVAQ